MTLERFGETLSEAEVEISDETCILRAEDAQKLVEPPRLAKLTLEPSRLNVSPKSLVVLKASGLDQYGQPLSAGVVEWSAPGCSISSSGELTAPETPGLYRVIARAAGLEAEAEMVVALAQQRPMGSGPQSQGVIRWSGAVPPQKWMNFYTKVLSRFAGSPGLVLTVSFEVSTDASQAKTKVEETRASLKELGLKDSVESS